MTDSLGMWKKMYIQVYVYVCICSHLDILTTWNHKQTDMLPLTGTSDSFIYLFFAELTLLG